MTKKLDIVSSDNYTFFNSNDIEKLGQVSSNIEQFRCNIDSLKNLQVILKQVPRLPYITIYESEGDPFIPALSYR